MWAGAKKYKFSFLLGAGPFVILRKEFSFMSFLILSLQHQFAKSSIWHIIIPFLCEASGAGKNYKKEVASFPGQNSGSLMKNVGLATGFARPPVFILPSNHFTAVVLKVGSFIIFRYRIILD